MGTEANSVKQSSSKYRVLAGPSRVVENLVFHALIFLGALWILEVYFYFGLTPMIKQYIGAFLGLSLGGIFLTIPFRKGRSIRKVPWYDWILFVLALMVGFYVAIFYPSILYVINMETTTRQPLFVFSF